jgi:hypothetical protein
MGQVLGGLDGKTKGRVVLGNMNEALVKAAYCLYCTESETGYIR